MIFASQNERTRKAVVWKLTQISRLAEKSLLCNVSMNTRLDDRSLTGGLSYFGGHAPATMPHATARNAPSPEYKLLQLIYYISGACTGHKCRRWQVPSKHLNPARGMYGKVRSSNIETAKQLDFSQAVSDKTISRPQSRVFKFLKGKNHIQHLET